MCRWRVCQRLTRHVVPTVPAPAHVETMEAREEHFGERPQLAAAEQGVGFGAVVDSAFGDVAFWTSCAIRGARGGDIGRRSPPGSSEE
jgi:hypothetical protein